MFRVLFILSTLTVIGSFIIHTFVSLVHQLIHAIIMVPLFWM